MARNWVAQHNAKVAAEAALKAVREAARGANPTPADTRDSAAEQIVALLGETFMPVMAVFKGSGSDATIVLRRLQAIAQRQARNNRKQSPCASFPVSTSDPDLPPSA